MPKLALSRCAYLVAAFGVFGGLLLAGPGWRAPPATALAAIDPMTLGVLVVLSVAVIGGGLYLTQAWLAASPSGSTTALRPTCPDGDGIAAILREPRTELDAVGLAARIFEDGLIRMPARVAQVPTATDIDATALIASVARQTSLRALKATAEAARAGAMGGDFAAAAAKVRDLAGLTARASGEITTQVARIAAAKDQAFSAVGEFADRTQDLRAAARIAAPTDQQAAHRMTSPAPGARSAERSRSRSTVRAA